MYKFIIYGRKSRNAQDGHTQHTFATSEWHINNYLKQLDAQGIPYEVVGCYEETLSGGGYYTNRPIFSSIVERCKKDKSLSLLVAKADRCARNLRSGTELMETINLVLANAPDADDMQKQLEFMIAEREYRTTSQRYQDTYKAKKDRCIKAGIKCEWGGNSSKWRETYNKNRAAGLHTTTKLFKDSPEKEKTVVAVKTALSYSSYQKLEEVADVLNKNGVTTATGKPWSKTNLYNFCNRNNIEWRKGV